MTEHRIVRALLSVSDKTGLVEFARGLHRHGIEILSTGGSAEALRQAGVPVIEVANHTGFPEIMDGRVKTLHPRIHGGILAKREDPAHSAAMAEHGIAPIDLVAVNLYPFRKTVEAGADNATAIETIDVGGPAMLRAAAKNHDWVTTVTDPSDYPHVIAELDSYNGATSLALRRRLAARTFEHTAWYDVGIATWMAERFVERSETTPEHLVLAADRSQVLRYGENPHQRAALYVSSGGILGDSRRPGVATAQKLQGKELSYNNLADADAALELVAELAAAPFSQPAIVIVKHANPCGVAFGATLEDAYRRALACDPVSAFGGIVAANRPIDGATAIAIATLFAEVIIAPGFTPEARDAFAGKANLRLLETAGLPDPASTGWRMQSLGGALLVQSRDSGRVDPAALRVVSKRPPTQAELSDMLFAAAVAKHVKSNAIVYVRDGATVGIGAGQMSRVDSSRIAAWKAREASEAAGEPQSRAQGSVVASDAFFPFADGLLAAASAGATAVIQPGGSVRDAEVIAAADSAGLAMVFTDIRHFRH